MVLLTPGPTPIPPRVQDALARPMRGHLDPEVLAINRRIAARLCELYGAPDGSLTAALAGTGSLGMEAGFVGLTQPGDEVLIVTNGSFGNRMVEMALRHQLVVNTVHSQPGQGLDLDQFAGELAKRPYRLVAVVHGETSTGVINPVQAMGDLVRDSGAYFMVDAVTTAGMTPLSLPELNADYLFTGSQKCLSAPPGLAPFALSPRARSELNQGRLWYADFNLVAGYWERGDYHYTAPVLLHYALEEALNLALEEGLAKRWTRARRIYAAAANVLGDLGFKLYADQGVRLPTVLAVIPPPEWDENTIRQGLAAEGVVVAGGIGPTAGRILRLGLMGEGARVVHYQAFFRALETVLGESGLVAAFESSLAPEVEATIFAEPVASGV